MIRIIFLSLCCVGLINFAVAEYRIGVGRADCTGPPVEIHFMGYASLTQQGTGLHLRQYSRAYIFEKNGKRAIFVTVDAGMIGHTIKRDVLARLNAKYPNEDFNNDNLVISGTHTHGTPGGFLKHVLYDLTILGFVAETYNALIDGITRSIERAHENMRNGKIYISDIEVEGVNMNRSPASYDNNPEEEKAQYNTNVDKTVVQMRFVDDSNNLFGCVNWVAIHPVSMNNTNTLVTTDNVGYASILLEKEFNKDLVGKGDFVCGFAASNLGDVSPNIKGAVCEKTGLPCDYVTSTCPDNTGPCFASGPGENMIESTKIIGTRLYEGALKLLLQESGREVTGDIGYEHEYVTFSERRTTYYNPKTRSMEDVRGCLPAMGYSFAAGTTDGPGASPFAQGTDTDNAFWNFVRDLIMKPTADDIECHSPKPILLATGRNHFPYDWQPATVSTQLLLVGDVAIVAVPGELTTMSGRRMRNKVRDASLAIGGPDVQVIIAGLSNIYSSYITTPEEYQIQRYEGASTIFGPHTLTIYIEQYQKLLQTIIKKESIEESVSIPDSDHKLISFVTPVVYDGHPIGKDFGYVHVQPLSAYWRGDTVYTKFVSANPRNDLRQEDTYFTVEKQGDSGNWHVVATDADWETKFKWTRVSTILGFSDLEFYWEISDTVEAGTYRIQHFGKSLSFGKLTPYTGTTNQFVIYSSKNKNVNKTVYHDEFAK
uniref:Neutral ceramidase n=1 Tax=Corethrella appendiculata TaxID=1370023 RepID=U5EWG2_9DIPT